MQDVHSQHNIEMVAGEGQQSCVSLSAARRWKFFLEPPQHPGRQVAADQIHAVLEKGNADPTRARPHFQDVCTGSDEVKYGGNPMPGDGVE